MRWFTELEDGYISSPEGRVFDSRLLDYRIDVDRVLGRLHPAERRVIEGVHSRGLTHADAVRQAGYKTERPDYVVARLEAQLGRMLELADMVDLLAYLKDR